MKKILNVFQSMAVGELINTHMSNTNTTGGKNIRIQFFFVGFV